MNDAIRIETKIIADFITRVNMNFQRRYIMIATPSAFRSQHHCNEDINPSPDNAPSSILQSSPHPVRTDGHSHKVHRSRDNSLPQLDPSHGNQETLKRLTLASLSDRQVSWKEMIALTIFRPILIT